MTAFSISISDPAPNTTLQPLTFSNAKVENLRIDWSASFIADSLAVDQLTCDLLLDSDSAARNAADRLRAFRRGHIVTLTAGTGSSATKTAFRFAPPAVRRFRITAVSPLALLDDSYHNGGLYHNATLSAVLTDILQAEYGGSAVLSIAIQDSPDYPGVSVADLPVSGYLPRAKRRENLQRLLLASGTILRRTAATGPDAASSGGQLVITLPRIFSTGTLPDSQIFLGGSVSCGERDIAQANVTEHEYLALDTDQVVTLFDNTTTQTSASQDKILFAQAPVHSLSVSGDLILNQEHCNFAVVTGRGVLTGKLYTHQTRLVSLSASDSHPGDNTAAVNDNGLIHAANADAVAQRILNWYNAAATVKMDIIHEGLGAWPLPGTLVSFTDPFGDRRSGYVTEMNSRFTSLERAALTLVSGYFPPPPGDSYDSSVELKNQNAAWTAPANMRVRILLIGGGSGGASGRGGNPATGDGNGSCGNGGEGGSGGSGARIRILTLDLAEHSTVTVTRIGAGGSYGAYSSGGSTPGTAGGDTGISVGSAAYSTGDTDSNGNPLYFTRPEGVHDLIDSSIIYAKDGPDGIPGNRGGTSSPTTLTAPNGVIYHNGNSGADYEYIDSHGNWSFTCDGGYGGGAAVGANGGNGGDATTNRTGAGGNGANAVRTFSTPTNSLAYGCGGSGGHGGGGGGGAGSYAHYNNGSAPIGAPGSGGSGCSGQKGASGAVIIYFKGGLSSS